MCGFIIVCGWILWSLKLIDVHALSIYKYQFTIFYSKISSLQEELDQALENLHNFVSEHEKIEKELVIKIVQFIFLVHEIKFELSIPVCSICIVCRNCLIMLGQHSYTYSYLNMYRYLRVSQKYFMVGAIYILITSNW